MEGREKVWSILSSSSFLTVYEADVCAAAEKVHDDGGLGSASADLMALSPSPLSQSHKSDGMCFSNNFNCPLIFSSHVDTSPSW